MDAKLRIEGIINKTISYSMQQNRINALKKIRIANLTEEEYEGLKVKISFAPQFASDLEVAVLKLAAYENIELKNIVPVINGDYLASLTEKEVGYVTVAVYNGEELLGSENSEIEILPYGQWSGTVYMPELLCAFVMPNHPAVQGIVAKAALWLEKWKGDPAILGYSTQNPNEVRMQMAAVYEAIKQEAIAYCLPPASYETVGQKIRTPDEITGQKMATCLDLTILYASALEAMGLNPLIMIHKEHAYIGCWLEEKSFAECVQDDVSALLKRTAEGIDEIALAECTVMTAGKNVSFEDACKTAKEQLQKEEEFRMAIDVERCRGGNIRPLPARVFENGVYTVVSYETEGGEAQAPKELSNVGRGATVTENTMTKQKLWERKLLDLSLRNTLLNFRVTKAGIQLMVDDPAHLEDALCHGEDFAIYPLPADSNLTPGSDKIFSVTDYAEEIKTVAVSEFKSKRIRTFMQEEDLVKGMKYLQRQAKLSIEENGSNTLYLALGFLKWYETEVSQKPRYAPLVLVPVDVTKKLQDKSYHIRIRDEEPQINITLLEFLRQDFGMDIGGLDPLPMDENGVDIPLVLNTVRQSIMEKKHWDVLPLTFLGIFSFSRFIMWNDLRNRSEEILSNKVVASLISGKMEWQPKETVGSQNADERIKPGDMAVVMSADASQMVAIETAAKGESFVLHGPPGTGKSQTITNMIANALYQGKSVLFVAEKMAALSVVQKRLEKVGLAPFCLELHSNKAQKQAVLKQLERTLEAGGKKSSGEFLAYADKLYAERCKLNEVVEALHEKQASGFSIYELIGKYELQKAYDGKVFFTEEWAMDVNRQAYDDCCSVLAQCGAVGEECGGINKHPLKEFKLYEYSMQLRKDWEEILSRYQVALKEKSSVLGQLSASLELPETASMDDLCLLERVLSYLLGMEEIHDTLLNQMYASEKEEAIREQITKGRDLQSIQKELLTHFKPAVFDYNVTDARQRLIAAQGKWVLGKKMDINALIKELRFLAINPNMVQEANLEKLYERIELYHKMKGAVTADPEFEAAFGGLYKGADTDWEKLTAVYEKHLALCRIFTDSESKEGFYAVLSGLIAGEGVAELVKAEKAGFEMFIEKSKACLEIENTLITEYGLDWNAFRKEEDLIPVLFERCGGWISHSEELRTYIAYCNAEKQAVELGLEELTEGYRNGMLSEAELVPVFECNFAKTAAGGAIASREVLTHFSGAGFTATIEKFCEISDKFELLTREETVARLSAKIPEAGEGFAGSSEIGILRKAIKSQRRAMPIRKLFNEIPVLLRRMCPCMLMSPISVAQYIDPSFPKFDLVIFDEASQLPTGESVGALARGENVIVVGDPKQLPPTSFFMTNQHDEEYAEVEDMESLLDDCLAISMPQNHLLWHYRSRHESLIAYSNMTYYDNKLYTFPSPNDRVSEVKWVYVEGQYDRGKTKQNRAEAEAVVEEVLRRLRDEELRKSSIGVVTFSSVQQELIDDLMQEALHKEPELEQYCVNVEEPLFIKNLENVQGDERDVILFSVGYGPDASGKVAMNFGPLNQDGGWRRLNVAISRSRKSMMIYSSFRPEKLDLSRTASAGIVGLKGFLEFAARGKNALYKSADDIKLRNSDVAKSIVARLKEAGYDADIDIGTSEYKVDIGVIDPENADHYCLGILLDGENYLAAQTARDRNLLQPSVLEGLGWKLHRIWTLDWLDTSEREFGKLEEAIKRALHPELYAEEEVTDAESADQNSDAQAEESIADDEADAEVIDEVNTEVIAGSISTDAAQESPAVKVQPVRKEYVQVQLPVLGDSEDFYEPKTKVQIMKAIEKTLQAEAPIEYDLMKKRVLMCWGMMRNTPKSDAVFEEILREVPVTQTNTAGNTFLWLDNMDPCKYAIYRIHEEGALEKRTLSQIPAEEAVNAVKEVLDKNVSLSRDDLVKEAAKVFGYNRVTASIDQVLGIAISYAEQRGYAEISEDGMRVLQKEQ
ncbi:MAG: DUF3320 domain-containing protein [Lachnospiraceae bacterium]|nr:DUF3320 domain-containing protein [Lachnospiraceae bacterium]